MTESTTKGPERLTTSGEEGLATPAASAGLEREISELIVSTLALEEVRPEDIDPKAALFGEGLGLDSIDALELGVALKRRFGVVLEANSEETRRSFTTVERLAQFIEARLSERAHG